MKNVNILILYEHPERELENILLLMHELQKRNFNCEILQIPADPFLMNKYYNKVNIVMVPYMYYNGDLYDCVYKIAGKADYIINFRWEQVLSVGAEGQKDAFWYPKEGAKSVKHICWGEIPYQRIIDSGVEEANLVITGALHLDFLREKLKKYYQKRETVFAEFGLNSLNKTILFISSFSSVNLSNDRVEHLKKVMGENEAEEFISLSTDSQKQILVWFKTLLEEGYTIVYRPHPSEELSEMICEFQNTYTNFKVIAGYSVKQWILVSDYVLSWISTSYAEAYVAGVPCGILRPMAIPAHREMTVLQNIDKIDSYNKLEQFLSEGKQVQNNALVEQYYQIDDDYAYKKIADYVERICKEPAERYVWAPEILQEFKEKRKKYLSDINRLKIVKILYKVLTFMHLTGRNNSFIKKVITYHKDLEKACERQESMRDNILNQNVEVIKKNIAEILN